MPDTVNLTVYVEQKGKEDVIDCLLPLTCISGFSISPCFGYSRDNAKLDLAEQVAGGRQLWKLDILHSDKDTNAIISALQSVNTHNPMRYVLSPVISHGHI